MITKRIFLALVITGVVAIPVSVLVNRFNLIGRAQLLPSPAGTWLIEISKSDDPRMKIQMLATFLCCASTDRGQILTSDTSDFGVSPTPCPGQRIVDRFQGPGHGIWEREGLTVRLLVLSIRFDESGRPIGLLKAEGAAQPRSSNTVIGKGTVSFFNGFDVSSPNAMPVCSVETDFIATRVELPEQRR